MKTTGIIAGLAAAAMTALGALPSRADDANYQNYIVGERAAGMGGAATADGGGVDAVFFNPAGLADTEKNSISLSANLYGFQRVRSRGYWYPGQDLEFSSFVAIPTTFGSVWKLGEGVSAAFAVFVPDRSSASELVAFPEDDHYFKYRLDDQTIWVGPSLGGRINERLALGISVFGVYRSFSWFRSWFLGSHEMSFSEDIIYDNLSLLAMLGARYDLDDNWRLGLRFQTPNARMAGTGNYLWKSFFYDRAEGRIYVNNTYVDDAESLNRLPAKVTAGAAYREEGSFSLGADVSLHPPISFNRIEGRTLLRSFVKWPLERRFTVDFNLGGEYYVAENHPVRLGFFTSRSSAPPPDPDKNWNPPRIDKYGLTASVGRESENTTMNLGLGYVWGSGKALGFDRGINRAAVPASHSALYLFVSSSYLF